MTYWQKPHGADHGQRPIVSWRLGGYGVGFRVTADGNGQHAPMRGERLDGSHHHEARRGWKREARGERIRPSEYGEKESVSPSD